MARARVPFVLGLALIAGVSGRPASAQVFAAGQFAPGQPGSVQSVQPVTAEVRQVREELERLRKEFDSLRRAYDDRLVQLEQRLAQIGGVQTAEPPPQTPPPAPARSSNVFNPDISVNGNFIAAAGKNPFATLDQVGADDEEVLALQLARGGLSRLRKCFEDAGLTRLWGIPSNRIERRGEDLVFRQRQMVVQVERKEEQFDERLAGVLSHGQ